MAQLALYNFRYRFYSPTLGRFLQTDPIGHFGDGYNIYRYCINNPVNFIDPTGQFGIVGAIFGGIAGAVGGGITGFAGGGIYGLAFGVLGGAIVGGALGLVAPEFSGEAAQALVGMAVGATSSYLGQVAGNEAASFVNTGSGSWSGFTDVNVGAIAASALGGGLFSDAFAEAGEELIQTSTEAAISMGVTNGAVEFVGGLTYDLISGNVDGYEPPILQSAATTLGNAFTDDNSDDDGASLADDGNDNFGGGTFAGSGPSGSIASIGGGGGSFSFSVGGQSFTVTASGYYGTDSDGGSYFVSNADADASAAVADFGDGSIPGDAGLLGTNASLGAAMMAAFNAHNLR